MTLKQDLKAQVVAELKAGNKRQAAILRTLLGEIQSAEKSGKTPTEWGNPEVEKFIRKNIRSRHVVAEEYTAAGKTERAADELFEAQYLSQFVPEQLNEAETRAIIDNVMKDFPNPTQKDMGRIMKAVTTIGAGRTDGKLVSSIVRDLL